MDATGRHEWQSKERERERERERENATYVNVVDRDGTCVANPNLAVVHEAQVVRWCRELHQQLSRLHEHARSVQRSARGCNTMSRRTLASRICRSSRVPSQTVSMSAICTQIMA